MQKMLTLNLALITHRPEGIERLARMFLPEISGVSYVVSWQEHMNAPVPEALKNRSDITIHRFNKPGLSLNRNNALEHCTGDIILFADDDLIYSEESLRSVITVFENDSTLDLATFISKSAKYRKFPSEPTLLKSKLPRNYSVASFEIAFRNNRNNPLRCCPELGLGAPLIQSGEDEMIVRSAIKRGMKCKFFPIEVCDHPLDSTGSKINPPKGVLRGFGCVIALTYPVTAILRVPLKAFRLSKAGQSGFMHALRYVASGALAAPGIFLRNRKYLW